MENEAEDDIDGALRDSGMGLLTEMESAGKKGLGDCGGGRGGGECEVRRRGCSGNEKAAVRASCSLMHR
jgi:hypothetical protein